MYSPDGSRLVLKVAPWMTNSFLPIMAIFFLSDVKLNYDILTFPILTLPLYGSTSLVSNSETGSWANTACSSVITATFIPGSILHVKFCSKSDVTSSKDKIPLICYLFTYFDVFVSVARKANSYIFSRNTLL